MRRVIVESPYAGDVERNLRYLRACLRDCLRRGEAPFASHGLYTQPGVLDDSLPAQREHGIQAGFAWRECADATVVYTNLGKSHGMECGVAAAEEFRAALRVQGWNPDQVHPIEYRQIGEGWDQLGAGS